LISGLVLSRVHCFCWTFHEGGALLLPVRAWRKILIRGGA
jgi:hypothetical protein